MEYFFLLILIVILGFLVNKSVNNSESYNNQFHNKNSIKEDLGLKWGTSSERELVSTLLKYGIPPQTIFHDLYLKRYYGKYSQIDLVVPTKVGIFVFEVKEYSGWIFGTGFKPQWLQILNYGRDKYYFYNPILQNAKHIEYLKQQLKQFENIPFYSIIVFDGDCELKEINLVPENTFLIKSRRVIEVINKILSEKINVKYSNKREIVNLLEQAVKNVEDEKVVFQHSLNINNMFGKERVYNWKFI